MGVCKGQMTKLAFIYLTSLILFFAQAQWGQNSSTIQRFQGEALDSLIVKKELSFLTKSENTLLRSYLLGKDEGRNSFFFRQIKSNHKTLYLNHLFTPSGLHFGSLFWMMTPFFSFLKRFNSSSLFKFSFYLFPFFFQDYFSLKRIGALKLIGQFKKSDTFLIFIIVFFFDLVFGSFNKNPYSFIFSFLFLGIIISRKDRPFSGFFWPLCGGQILASFVTNGSFNLLGFFFGNILSFIFVFLFPVYIILYLFEFSFFSFTLKVFMKLISTASSISILFPTIIPDLFIFFLVFYISLRFKKKLSIIFICCLFHSENIYNLPQSQRRDSQFWPTLAPLNIEDKLKKVSISRGHFRLVYKDGLICKAKLYNTRYRLTCQYH